MADPLHVVSSLDTLADHYAVFEPDQVLTHGQLNSLSDYLGDQLRLSRVVLDGVGLIAGLQVSQSAAGVRISAGFGVSTDGDLMRLGGDTVYDRFRPYDRSAPIYAPLYRRLVERVVRDRTDTRTDTRTDATTDRPTDNTETSAASTDMLTLQELVPVGESDVLALPLADLAGGLADKAVLMLMETVVNDPDLCSGTDCDNLGRDALHRQRFLLISRADAQALLDRLPLSPVSARARSLPALAMRRPVLGRDITTVGGLAARYRDSASASLRDLLRALPLLSRQCPEVLAELLSGDLGDPTARWTGRLNDLDNRFSSTGSSAEAQVWYGFVKDLIDHWRELRQALLADDGVMLPAVASFPKHLLLGALAAPRQQRMALYPSPLDASARRHAAQGRFLARKLDGLIRAFAMPTDTTTRITPSLGDAHPLQDRAIPWHYGLLADAPIQAAWNFSLSSRHGEGENLGYRSDLWASSAQARDPLAFGVGGHDFFRIEGHLGRPVEAVGNEIRRIISERHLPIQVQEVLLHNDRRLIKRRPPIRPTPLHSLHYLLRQDLSQRLDESQTFGSRYLGDVTAAVGSGQVPGVSDSGASVVTTANNALSAITSLQASARPVLGQTRHSDYQAQMAASGAAWKTSYATALESVGNTRASLGHVSRPDFVSPYDSLLQINTPHWIGWLDDLIQADDERADDKLLFARFVQDHPGLDHLGGAWRGGSFVLVYDDGGRVVGDFCLPYPAAEADLPEPVQPPLARPPYRPPVIVSGGIRVLRPLELKVSDRVTLERQSFQFELDKQSASIQGLVQGVFVPNNAVTPKAGLKPGLSGDNYLDFQAGRLVDQRELVKGLQDLISQPGQPAETRVLFERDLAAAQNTLADLVGQVTGRVVTANVDVTSAGSQALTQQLTSSVAMLQDSSAKARLNTQLTTVATTANAGQAALIGNLRTIGRLG
jgi:hypothetical protein